MKFNTEQLKDAENKHLYLATVSKEILGVITDVTDIRLTVKMLEYSELSFTVTRTNENKDIFEKLDIYKKIYIEDMGWFILDLPTMKDDGEKITKDCTAKSAEYEFSLRNVENLAVNVGTKTSQEWIVYCKEHPDFDFDNPDYEHILSNEEYVYLYRTDKPELSLLNILLEKFPHWSIGYIDESLIYKKTQLIRNEGNIHQIEEYTGSVYSLINEQVSNLYKCVFVWDCNDYTINAYPINKVGELEQNNTLGYQTDVYITHQNIMDDFTLSPNTEDSTVTMVQVSGGDNVDILDVNLGTNNLYDFSYFLNEMPTDLARKVLSWQMARKSAFPAYIDNAQKIYNSNATILSLSYKTPYSDNNKAKELTITLGENFKLGDWVENKQPNQKGGYTTVSGYTVEPDLTLFGTSELLNYAKIYEDRIQRYRDVQSDSALLKEAAAAVRSLYEVLYGQSWYYVEPGSANHKADNVSANPMGGLMKQIKEAEKTKDDLMKLQTEAFNKYDFTKYFTNDELKLLYPYVTESSFEDTTYVITDRYGIAEITEVQQDLRNAAELLLTKLSQPQYVVSVDLLNLFKIRGMENVYPKFQIGNFVNVQKDDYYSYDLRLIQIDYEFSNPSSMKVTFSNMMKDRNGLNDLDYLLKSLTTATISEIKSKASTNMSGSNKESVSPIVISSGNIQNVNAEGAIVTGSGITAANTVFGTVTGNYIATRVIEADKGYFDELSARVIDAEEANIKDLTANNVTADYLDAKVAELGYLDADKADINYAKINFENVNNSWIENGVIKNAAITNEMVGNISANKLTAGTLDASKVTVSNLNASNITTGTLTVGGLTINVAESKAEIDGGTAIKDGSITLSGLSKEVTDLMDGAIETFTTDAIPTLTNYPAKDWSTSDYAKHVGDICYVINPASEYDGYSYRFINNKVEGGSDNYEWILIKDSDTTKILAELVEINGDLSGLKKFESETNTWISKTDEELSSVKSRTTTIEADYSTKVEAQGYASTAKSEAISSANTTAQGYANTAKSEAISSANTTAQEYANTAKSEAISAAAADAKTKADGALADAKTYADQVVSTKVESTVFNEVKQTVDENSASITSMSDTLSKKADSSTVTTLSQTVNSVKQTTDSNTASITNLTTSVNSAYKTTTIYYLATNTSKGVTTSTPGWTTTIQTVTAENRFLWTYNKYTDIGGNTTNSTPVVTGVYGDTGSQGIAGASEWTTTVAPTTPNYTFTIANLSGSSAKTPAVGDLVFYSYYRYTITSVGTTTVLTGNRQSLRGATGATGTGITSVTPLYYASNSQTVPAAPTAQVIVDDVTKYNQWNKSVPPYTTTYRYFYTCSEVLYSDNTRKWTNVARDTALETANATAESASVKAVAVEQSLDGFKTTVSNTYQTKDDMSNYSTTEQMNTAITQSAESITLAVNSYTDTSVANIEIGGRNLIINTNNPGTTASERPKILGQTTNTGVRLDTEKVEHGIGSTTDSASYPYVRFGASSSSSATMNGLVAGKTYTISCDISALLYSQDTTTNTRALTFYVYMIETGGSSFVYAIPPVNIITFANGEKGTKKESRFEHTFTIPDNASAIYLLFRTNSTTATYHTANVDYIKLRNLKLELGNKATTWTPAPEDIQSQIDTHSSEIKQNADSIGLVVKSGSTESSLTLTDSALSAIADNIILTGTTTFKSALNKTIKTDTLYYLATTASSGVTTSTSGWTTTTQSVTADKRYLWTYHKYTYTDGTTSNSSPVITGVWGNTGSKGDTGTSVTISSTSVTYQASTSGTTTPTGTWSTTVPTVTKGQYLWTKTVVTYSTGTSTTSYSVAYEGTNGNNGNDGATIWTTTVAPVAPNYTFTISNLTGNTGTPKVGDLIVYSYYRYTITSVDTTTVLTGSRTSIRGATGAAGTSVSITSTETTYQVSNSATTVPTGTWDVNIPTTSVANPYLWTKTYVLYSTGSSTTSYGVSSTTDSIEIGGRNLIQDGNKEYTTVYNSADKGDGKGYIIIDITTGNLLTNTDYTLSLDVKSSNGTDVFYASLAHNNNSRVYFSRKATTTSTYQRMSFVVNTATHADLNRFLLASGATLGTNTGNTGTVYYKNIKLEKGNKATDWTPAPEDNISIQKLYYLKSNSTAPSKPTAEITSVAVGSGAWTTVIPNPVANYYYFTCDQKKDGVGTVTWTDVVKLNTESTLLQWCADTDVTQIDGGKIYANSVTAAKIDVTDLFSQNITATNFNLTGGSIAVDTTDDTNYLVLRGTDSTDRVVTTIKPNEISTQRSIQSIRGGVTIGSYGSSSDTDTTTTYNYGGHIDVTSGYGRKRKSDGAISPGTNLGSVSIDANDGIGIYTMGDGIELTSDGISCASATAGLLTTEIKHQYIGTERVQAAESVTLGSSNKSDASIKYQNVDGTFTPIQFKRGDAYGAGIVIGAGGLTVIGGGESAQNFVDLGVTYGTERLILTSDDSIYFHTNCQDISKRVTSSIDTAGSLSINNVYAENLLYAKKTVTAKWGSYVAGNFTLGSKNGYIHVARFWFNSTYVNAPIKMHVSQREFEYDLCFQLANDSRFDGSTIKYFYVDGKHPEVYAYKTHWGSGGTLTHQTVDIFIQTASAYDDITITNLEIPYYLQARLEKIEYPGTEATKQSYWIAASHKTPTFAGTLSRAGGSVVLQYVPYCTKCLITVNQLSGYAGYIKQTITAFIGGIYSDSTFNKTAWGCLGDTGQYSGQVSTQVTNGSITLSIANAGSSGTPTVYYTAMWLP